MIQVEGISGGGSENLDTVLARQETLIEDIKTALEGKTSGGSQGTCTITLTNRAADDFDPVYFEPVLYIAADGSFGMINEPGTSEVEVSVLCGTHMTAMPMASDGVGWEAPNGITYQYDNSGIEVLQILVPDTPGNYTFTFWNGADWV